MRTVGVKVLADSAQYERAMLESGASTETLAKTMDKAAKQSRNLTQATNAARTAALEQAAAERAAASATDRSAAAAKKASRAQIEAGAAAENAAEAAQKLERGEISAAEAQKLAATAARKDRDAQFANAAAEKAAAVEAERLERASIKAAAAQLAMAKAAKAAGEAAGSRGLTRKQGGSLLNSLVGDGTIVGEDAAKAFVEGFQSTAQAGSKNVLKDLAAGVGSAGEVLMPALVGAAIGAAPFVLAAVGGAVLAGVGAAGIGLGIAGQVQSPAVKAAWVNLGNFAKQRLAQATLGVEQPLVHAAEIFGHQLDLSTGSLQKFVDEVTPEIDSLAQGLASMFGNIAVYLPEVGEAAKPLLDLLANELPKAGEYIGEFLRDITTDTRGASEGLAVLFQLFYAGLKLLGSTIAGAEYAVDQFFLSIYEMVTLAAKIPGPLQETFKSLKRSMENNLETTHRAAAGVDGFGKSAADTSKAVQDLNDQVSDLNDTFDSSLGASLDATSAALKFKDALAGLKEAVDQNGTSLSENTKKGRQNRETLISAVQAAKQARDAYIAQHSATDGVAKATADANAIFAKNISTLEKQAESAGFSKDQVRGLLVQLGLLPSKKSSKISVPGAAESSRLLQIIQQRLAGIKDKYVTVHVSYKDTAGNTIYHSQVGMGPGGYQKADGGIMEYYANGGIRDPQHIAQIVPAGSYRIFGEPETGGEAYIPLAESKRTRSAAVLEAVAQRFGMPMGQAAFVAQAAAPVVTLRPQFDVQVMLGNENITKLVDVRITEHDRQVERGVGAGRRR